MIEVGTLVTSAIDMQPLKKGDRGIVKEIDRELPFPLMVRFNTLSHDLPMKFQEVREVK